MAAPASRKASRSAPRTVVALAQARITRALDQRVRYKYVQPRVEVQYEGSQAGWKIVSPNCSRNIDTNGGEIDIAWFVQTPDGRWALHARDHARSNWRLMAVGLSLDAALAQVCADPLRVYWP
jgi:hypothetical protein